MKQIILGMAVIIVGIHSAAAAAGGATGSGNGGDMCADRIMTIAADIDSWIALGGADTLQLPPSVSLASYKAGMQKEIQAAVVSCTDSVVQIGQSVRVCENFVDQSGTARIVCNRTDFLQNTTDSDQYTLIHHEYAGLAGFEVNDGENSNYAISNQISGYLENQTVKKLVVKSPDKPESDLDGHYILQNGVANCDQTIDVSSTALETISPSGAAIPAGYAVLIGGYTYEDTSDLNSNRNGNVFSIELQSSPDYQGPDCEITADFQVEDQLTTTENCEGAKQIQCVFTK